MKNLLPSLLILSSLVLGSTACRDVAKSDESSELTAVDARNNYAVKGKSGRNHVVQVISVTNDRAFYPICPAGSIAPDLGVKVQASRVVYSTNDNTHFFLWMTRSTNWSQTGNICNIRGNTRSQYAQQGGCTCLRKK